MRRAAQRALAVLGAGVVVVVALLALPRSAAAAGYAISDQGTRALSMSLATAATLDGPESLFYNPAGLAGLERWQVAGGLTALRLDVTSTPVTSGLTSESSRDHFEIPHLYVARGIMPNAKGAMKRWAFGLSVNAPFGLATDWPKDYEGRFISRIADLKTMQLGALAAVRLPKGWSLGFGPTWTTGEVQLVRDVDLSIFRRGHQAEANLSGDGSTLGWRAGLRWQGSSGWRVGAMMHGQSELTFDGKVDYTVVPLGAYSIDQAIDRLFQDGPASTTLTLPASAWLGVGLVRERWAFEVGSTWTNWSVMDEVIVDLQPVESGGYEFVTTQFLTPQWHDTWALRASYRRALGAKWSLLTGAAYDAAPAPKRTVDPLLPDSDRVLLSVGATRAGEHFTLDFGLQSVFFEPLDTKGTGNTFESSYDSSALAVGITAGWRFGG